MDIGARYVIEAGKKAECDIETITKALVTYHSFMRIVEPVRYDPAMVAAASLRSCCRMINKELDVDGLVFLFYHIVNRNTDSLYPGSVKFDVLKKSLITVEFVMERLLEFTYPNAIAHQYLVPFLDVLHSRANYIDGFLKSMIDICMRFISDFYTNKMCLNYKAEDIAIACIDAALHVRGFVHDLEMVSNWYEGFCANLTEKKVEEMKIRLLGLYKKPHRSAGIEEITSDSEDEIDKALLENSFGPSRYSKLLR